jgi:hypothetical protein
VWFEVNSKRQFASPKRSRLSNYESTQRDNPAEQHRLTLVSFLGKVRLIMSYEQCCRVYIGTKFWGELTLFNRRSKSKVKLSHYRHACTKWQTNNSSYSFSTLALDGGEWSESSSGRALPRERTSGTHWIGGVGPRTGLDTEARLKIILPLPQIEPRSSSL